MAKNKSQISHPKSGPSGMPSVKNSAYVKAHRKPKANPAGLCQFPSK